MLPRLLVMILAAQMLSPVSEAGTRSIGDHTNCGVLLRGGKLEVDLKLSSEDHKEQLAIAAIFHSLPRLSAPGIAVVAGSSNGHTTLTLLDLSFLNANQFGYSDCMFTGRSADVLLEHLLRSNSTLVKKLNRRAEGSNGGKTEAINSATIEVKSGILTCSSSLYGSTEERPVCQLRPYKQ
jgi:hypothetical protein